VGFVFVAGLLGGRVELGGVVVYPLPEVAGVGEVGLVGAGGAGGACGGVEPGGVVGRGARAVGIGRCLSRRGCWARRTLVGTRRGRERGLMARRVTVPRGSAVTLVVGGAATGPAWAGAGWGAAFAGGAETGVETGAAPLGLSGGPEAAAVGRFDLGAGLGARAAFLA
jgi:hypothetical protein